MKRFWMTLGVLATLPLIVPLAALAVDELPAPSLMLISEAQVSGSGEFVELVNVSPVNINVSDWQLEYFTGSTTDFSAPPSYKILLNGIVGPGQHYLLAKNDFEAPLVHQHFNFSLADSGAYLRLTSPGGEENAQRIIQDFLGWKSTTPPAESQLVYAPRKSGDPDKSLQRKTNENNALVNTGNAATDFEYELNPSPAADPLIIPEPETGEVNETLAANTEIANGGSTDTGTEPVTSAEPEPAAQLSPPIISELMPNPAAPKTDDADEFVELYNPNNEPLELKGMTLQTGNSFSYSYRFSDGVIEPGSYQAFYVPATGLVLANSGGKARLLDTNGNKVGETDTYSDAKEGEAWALLDGVWQWTITPTPDEANILTTKPESLVAAVKSAKKTSAKSQTAKPKAVKAKATSKKAGAKPTAAVAGEPEPPVAASVNSKVLALVGGSALLYAAYEYYPDLSNRLYQLRRYREARRAARTLS